MINQQTNYDKGLKAEERASEFLIQNGYTILERRYKTEYGEIDIIAHKEKTLSFIEVKTRPTEAEALESITLRTKQRISNAASLYLAHHTQDYDVVRFDVVAVTSQSISYLENAWRIDELS